MKSRMLLVACLAAVLAAVVGWQLLERTPAQPGRGVHLAGVLPLELAGRQSRPLELGPQEAAAAAVREALRCDDVFYREYRQPGRGAFTVYVAYWNPGSVPVQVVAAHAPDRCWTSAGWTCVGLNHHLRLETATHRLREAQGRTFRDAAGRIQEVAYWHLIGDRLFDFGERLNQRPDALKWWREVVRSAWAPPEEQYFVRLSSDRPFEELESDPGFREMLSALAKLGLAAEPQ